MSGETKTVGLTGPYLPSPNGETLSFKITVTTSTARLASLLPSTIIPNVADAESDPALTGVTKKPNHMFVQVPVGATNKVYMTWDNVTTPTAGDGGPGFELQPGVIYPFENCRNLLTPKTTAPYKVDALSAFQLRSKTGSQDIAVWFCE